MKEIHEFSKTLRMEEKFHLQDHIERSTNSVCDNIAGGYSTYYFNDKIKGFMTARKEAGEAQSQIKTLYAKGYLNHSGCQFWVESYEEVIRGINGYVRYIRVEKNKKE